MYHQQMQQAGQQQMPHGGQVPVNYGQQGVPVHPGQPPPRMPFDPSKGHEVPLSIGMVQPPHGPDSQLKGAEAVLPEGTRKEQGVKSDLNRPKSSLEEKTEEHDNIDDFLGMDYKSEICPN